jgi:SpoVK/Ycf46/Vps4 family AAA+-type ATPase
MFLTTNRPSTIDWAFMSRIHLWINYPNLDLEARRKIWSTFVRPQDDHSIYASNISDQTLDRLAEEELNGREIKNIVKTARLLSSRENTLLAKEHVDTVLRVRKASALVLR